MTMDSQSANAECRVSEALAEIEQTSPHQTDGKWLEHLTRDCAPLIADWDVGDAWLWQEWPDRKFADLGIDVVARRKSDGRYVAIQCKSRKLDEHGRGADIAKTEFDSFLAHSADPFWAERWLVVNGDVRLGHNAEATVGQKPVKRINIESDLRKQQDMAQPPRPEPCPHCDGSGERRTRDCMQEEAIETSVTLLQEHAKANGSGRARGRIILPCGTGKSRIALRIVERLTEPGQVSAVLCPSIALVSQLRAEFLAHCAVGMNALAVCSDEGVAKDKDLASDPTADLGYASASEVKGIVTTRADEIGQWIDAVADEGERIGVIFGTYQSSHRIAEALGDGRQVQLMVADEAHRTAGLRRITKLTESLRDFTVCHDDARFPARYRIYQTATPRIYTGGPQKNDDWVVRDMADESVFGPELYRQSYGTAVTNGWLTDYRIIAIGVNDEDAYRTANELAERQGGRLSTAHFLRGLVLALAMGGALRAKGVNIRSSINFMNLIARSRGMTEALGSEAVRDWVRRRLEAEGAEAPSAAYRLEHLDATSRVAEREYAKARLMGATDEAPHGILNVGIFGEGVDAPALSAVGFLEARKSPVDVIQAVGRVMRRAENKEMGYIICPILIPPNTDAETWLRTSGPEDGWRELGQILLALRAHDGRIEDRLSDLMQLYLPPPPAKVVATMITIGGEDRRVQHYGHVGKPGTAEGDVEKVLAGKAKPGEVFLSLGEVMAPAVPGLAEPARPFSGLTAERIVSGKHREDGSVELREAGTVRSKAGADGTPGPVDAGKSKQAGRKMVNGQAGHRLDRRQRAQQREARAAERIRGLFDQVEDVGISVNLLARSGLARNRAERDVNVLEDSVREAKRCLKGDELDALLDRHFGLDQLADDKRKAQADGCTIAALLLMNAAMLHQRIAAGGWLPGISGMDAIKSAPDAIMEVYSQWNRITRHDFQPVIAPAIDIIEEVQRSGRKTGLNRALRHLAGEAERIAESYADLGADHAGPLFNKVMGNQASDGAYFTRPPAATLLARLTLDAAGQEADWTENATWRVHRTVDLACGSGTLIAAMLAEMKRRAGDRGADRQRQAELQKLAVEELIAGLDFNPVSLQLAAAQLTAGNRDVAYRRIGLHRMPYGPRGGKVSVGTPELLGQKSILRSAGFDLDEESLGSEQLRMAEDDPLLGDAADAVRNVRIVVMNPPFTNRSKMGEKFPKEVQKRMRERVDSHERTLVAVDPEMEDFGDKNSVGPLFVSLADKCLDPADGLLAMINPTIALTSTSGRQERVVLARRFQIHTLLTCHDPRQINLSQNTSINESMIIAKRHEGARPPTRIISLDRFPSDEGEADELHRHLAACATRLLPDGWGEVSEWPAERIEAGDWSAAAFRSPELADAAVRIANSRRLLSIGKQGAVPSAVLQGGAQMSVLAKANSGAPGSFPVLYYKGAEAQKRIRAEPDTYLVSTKQTKSDGLFDGREVSHAEKLLQNAGYLLVTSGQDTSTARLTAVASEVKYIGVGWMPVPGITFEQAKAAAVFLNSTAGRLQLMQNPGKKLTFPIYRPGSYDEIGIPDLADDTVTSSLADCWDRTRDMGVPQYRDGECDVRRLWDEAVAEALEWDPVWLSRLRLQLHDEPHVRGLGRNQFGD